MGTPNEDDGPTPASKIDPGGKKNKKEEDTPNEDDEPTPASKIDPGGKKNKKEDDTPNEDDGPTPASKIDPGGKKNKKEDDTSNERMYVIRSNNDEEMPSAQFKTGSRYRQPDPQWLTGVRGGPPGPQWFFSDGNTMEDGMPGLPGGGVGYDDYFVESPG